MKAFREFYNDEFLPAVAEKLPAGSKVLNIGKHKRFAGKYNEMLAHCELEELDIDPAMKPDIVADIDYWKRPGYYDCVIFVGCNDRVKNPFIVMDNIWESLKPGGLLVISAVCNYDFSVAYWRTTIAGAKRLIEGFDILSTDICPGVLGACETIVMTARKPAMNKRFAIKIMRDVKRIMTSLAIPYVFVGGTCLGAFRNKDFIDFEKEDLDVGLCSEYATDNLYRILIADGFRIGEKRVFKDKVNFWSASKYGIHICLDFHYLDKDMRVTESKSFYYALPRKFIEKSRLISFYGEVFPFPKDTEEYLEYIYQDWKTPAKALEPLPHFYRPTVMVRK